MTRNLSKKEKKIILFRPAWSGKSVDSGITEVSGEDEKQQLFTNSVLYYRVSLHPPSSTADI